MENQVRHYAELPDVEALAPLAYRMKSCASFLGDPFLKERKEGKKEERKGGREGETNVSGWLFHLKPSRGKEKLYKEMWLLRNLPSSNFSSSWGPLGEAE